MLFNSISFAIFLPIVFLLYWFVTNRSLQFQNLLLLVSSYFFYACWDWRFMLLLIFSTCLDFYTGFRIADAHEKLSKKIWLWISIVINLGLLALFKYYNFFAQSFSDALRLIGFQTNISTLKIILPVGISFYTFHGLSYVIDIYNDKIKPEKSFVNYSVFVSFFPLLVAGPIERATHLLPQILKKRTFEYEKAVDGLRQILWGLFKKIVIADNCAEYANMIFNHSQAYEGSTLFLGALFFTFQIYCDFSGYSDIALGSARLFGIELLRNFSFPYFSRDIAEFWRRWHISLSSWFKDYLYIPLGGSQGGTIKKMRNTFIIFLVSGFWHGANWTFIVWGLLNALYIMPSIVWNTNRNNLDIVAAGKRFPSIKEFSQIIITFILTTLAWIFFRSDNLHQAFQILAKIFSFSIVSIPQIRPSYVIVLVIIFMVIEWLGRQNKYAIEKTFIHKNKIIRWSFYLCICLCIFIFNGKAQEFIYFQF